jgi:hypothetical protein
MAKHKPPARCVICCRRRIVDGGSTCNTTECQLLFERNEAEREERPGHIETDNVPLYFGFGTGGGKRIIRTTRGLA